MRLICCSFAESVYISGEEFFNETVNEITSGSFSLSAEGIIQFLVSAVTEQISELTYYVVVFFIIAAVTAVLNMMGQSFRSNVDEVSFFAGYVLVSAAAIKCYCICLEYATETVNDITDFITKLSPVLTTLLFTSGAPVSAGAFHPVLASAVYVVSLICRKCIIPLSAYSTVLSVANNISDQVQITGACRLISSASKWILALSFTVFTGICGIYGFTAPSLDVLGAKTVKFAVGSLVPVVGGFLSDTMETVISGSKMMKNAVGSAGMIAVCVICAVPVIKIGVMAFTVKISAALVEPVTDSRIYRLLSDISGAITILFGMVATSAVLFLICISIILAMTGVG